MIYRLSSLFIILFIISFSTNAGEVGYLDLTTNIDSISIFINDEFVGYTPLNPMKLDIGDYLIVAKKRFYTTQEKHISITVNNVIKINFKLIHSDDTWVESPINNESVVNGVGSITIGTTSRDILAKLDDITLKNSIPSRIDNVPSGPHVITLLKNDEKYKIDVIVKTDDNIFIDVDSEIENIDNNRRIAEATSKKNSFRLILQDAGKPKLYLDNSYLDIMPINNVYFIPIMDNNTHHLVIKENGYHDVTKKFIMGDSTNNEFVMNRISLAEYEDLKFIGKKHIAMKYPEQYGTLPHNYQVGITDAKGHNHTLNININTTITNNNDTIMMGYKVSATYAGSNYLIEEVVPGIYPVYDFNVTKTEIIGPFVFYLHASKNLLSKAYRNKRSPTIHIEVRLSRNDINDIELIKNESYYYLTNSYIY